jgi:prevent-host-death family protein
MYKVPRDATIATVTELRRNTAELMAEADAGSIVLVQKDNEPRGVYMSYGKYERLLQRLDRLEVLEIAELAIARKTAVDSGAMGTTSLDEMIAEFAPELRLSAGEKVGA